MKISKLLIFAKKCGQFSSSFFNFEGSLSELAPFLSEEQNRSAAFYFLAESRIKLNCTSSYTKKFIINLYIGFKTFNLSPFSIYSMPHFTKLCTLDVRNVLPAHINIVSKYAYCLENI